MTSGAAVAASSASANRVFHIKAPIRDDTSSSQQLVLYSQSVSSANRRRRQQWAHQPGLPSVHLSGAPMPDCPPINFLPASIHYTVNATAICLPICNSTKSPPPPLLLEVNGPLWRRSGSIVTTSATIQAEDGSTSLVALVQPPLEPTSLLVRASGPTETWIHLPQPSWVEQQSDDVMERLQRPWLAELRVPSLEAVRRVEQLVGRQCRLKENTWTDVIRGALTGSQLRLVGNATVIEARLP